MPSKKLRSFHGSNFQYHAYFKGQTTSLNILKSQFKQFHVMVWGVMSVKNPDTLTSYLNCWRHNRMQISYIWSHFTDNWWSWYRYRIWDKWLNINLIIGKGGKCCISITFSTILCNASAQWQSILACFQEVEVEQSVMTQRQMTLRICNPYQHLS